MTALLSLDSGAGLLVGGLMLVFAEWLGQLLGLPPSLLRSTAAVNVLYGLYSGSLAAQALAGRRPSRTALRLLVWANAAWLPVCVGIAIAYWSATAWLGSGYFLGEGLFVGGLAWWEARVFLGGAANEGGEAGGSRA